MERVIWCVQNMFTFAIAIVCVEHRSVCGCESAHGVRVCTVVRARMIVKNVYADEECAHHKSICGVNA